MPQRVDLGPWLDQLGAGRVKVDLQLQGQVVPGGHQTPQLRRHVHKVRLRNTGTAHLCNASLHFALGLDQQGHHLLCIAVAETDTSTMSKSCIMVADWNRHKYQYKRCIDADWNISKYHEQELCSGHWNTQVPWSRAAQQLLTETDTSTMSKCCVAVAEGDTSTMSKFCVAVTETDKHHEQVLCSGHWNRQAPWASAV